MDRPTRTDWPTRIVLGLVMAAALAVGTWSVYTLLRELLHAPKEIALLGCAMFDGAAFFFARLAQRYATSPDSGLAPRLAMLAMICASSWVNWQHAELKHWGLVGSVVLAAAPVVAELAFEMWHRYEHREALRSRGRVAEALPVLGKWAWITHPRRARKVVDAHIVARLKRVEAAAAPRDADSISLTREDAQHHEAPAPVEAPQPQHVVIEVRHPPAIAPAGAQNAPQEEAPEAQHDTPREKPALRPAPPEGAPRSAPHAPDVLDLTGMSKSEAVLRLKREHPDDSAPALARRLAQHGVEVKDNYVRTVLGRNKPKPDPGQGFYP